MGTYDQDKREKLSIFSFFVVDIYNVTKQSLAYEETSNEFLCALDEVKIDNDLDNNPTRLQFQRTRRNSLPIPTRIYPTWHLLQTSNKCRLHNGIWTNFHKKVRDRFFQMKITWMSSIFLCLRPGWWALVLRFQSQQIIFSAACWWHPLGPKIKLQLMIVIYVIGYDLFK